LDEGKIKDRGKGKWQVQRGHAMPGQSVALLFIADHLQINQGRLIVAVEHPLGFSAERIALGNHWVGEMKSKEFELGFERWRLGQLRKFGDQGTALPNLREEAKRQLTTYLEAVSEEE